MDFPTRPAYQSTTFNQERNQLEVINEHISPTTRFKIIDNSKLSQEQLNDIRLFVEDSNNRIFNINTLDNLINFENKESDRLIIPLLEGGVEAVSPLKFVFKSASIDLENYNFKISW